jgi:hypothetical protein
VSENQSAFSVPRPRLTEDEALGLATEAVERAGGTRRIYRNPRHPFALNPTSDYEIEGHEVEIRWGEISSPAVVSVGGYVFQINEEELELLIRPPKPRPPS